MLVGIVDKLPHGVLALEVTGELQHLLEVLHLLTVVVRVGEGKLQNQSTHCCLLIIRGHTDGILGHEDIWCDATASVDHATDTRVISRARMLDAAV